MEQELDLLAPGLTLARYTQILAAFYGFYLPFESKVHAAMPSAVATLFANRWKAPLLTADLRTLGFTPTDTPLCTALPDWHSPAEVLGSLYVVEGSTLGGQSIARELEQRLGLRDGVAYSFFRGYGSETGTRWRQFRAFLTRHSTAATDDLVVRGAVLTFRSLRSWFRQALPKGADAQ